LALGFSVNVIQACHISPIIIKILAKGNDYEKRAG
jgi:hypothetical protein